MSLCFSPSPAPLALVLAIAFLLQGMQSAAAQLSAAQQAEADQATKLLAEADGLRRSGNKREARALIEKSLEIRRRVFGNHPATAQSLQALAGITHDLGEFAAARPFAEQALAMRQQTRGAEHLETADSHALLAQIINSRADPVASRPHYEEALKIRQKLLGDHAATAHSHNDLAFYFSNIKQYPASIRHTEEALRIQKKVLPPDHVDFTRTYNSLGNTLSITRDLPAAQSYLEEALRLKLKHYGEDHPSTATGYVNLAWVAEYQGNHSKAEELMQRAHNIRVRTLGEMHPDTTLTLMNLSDMSVAKGDYAQARTHLNAALSTQQKTIGDNQPVTAHTRHQLMLLDARLGDWDSAAERCDRARRAMHEHVSRLLPTLSEKEQVAYLKAKEIGKFYTALSLGLEQRKQPRMVERSALWLLNGKGVTHEALATNALLGRNATDPQSAATVRALQEVRRKLAELSLGGAARDTQGRETLKRLEAEETELARKLSQSGAFATSEWAEIESLRQRIPADAVFIDIARFPVCKFDGRPGEFSTPNYAAWVIPPAGELEIRLVNLGPAAAIDDAIDKARRTITAAATAEGALQREGEPAAQKQAQTDLQAVADLVWKPLATTAVSAKQLIISPDGALWLLPWAALPIDENRCLLEQYALNLVVTGRDLLPKHEQAGQIGKPMIFADPDFDLAPGGTRQAIQAVFPGEKLPADSETRGFSAQSALPAVRRLPGTATEAQAVLPLVTQIAKAAPTVYTDTYALESIAKRVQRPSYLILSTHGFFLPEQAVALDQPGESSSATKGGPLENPLLRCGLLFAGCNAKRSTAGDDGILTGMEIVGIDLRGTELVVLSACETGVGEVKNGEGVAGLRQAFQLAGARSVVASLWQVPDRDSALIMNDFFTGLAEGQAKSEALRAAQLKRIAARRDRHGAAHPFFWAAWTITGGLQGDKSGGTNSSGGIAAAPASPPPTPGEPAPADRTVAFQGHRYQFFKEQLPWSKAQAQCEALGGRLVVIDSAEENAFVASLVEKAGAEDCWLGITDQVKEGEWLDVRGKSVAYLNWYPSQPNNKGAGEHFALMSNKQSGGTRLGWKWSDQPDVSTQHRPGFVCEWDTARP